MSDLIANTFTHLHPAITHFPIVLLIASVLLDLYGRRQPAVRRTAWITLLLGTFSTIPAVVTGIIAHHVQRDQIPQSAPPTDFVRVRPFLFARRCPTVTPVRLTTESRASARLRLIRTPASFASYQSWARPFGPFRTRRARRK